MLDVEGEAQIQQDQLIVDFEQARLIAMCSTHLDNNEV